jgi:signal transduction histidine kinase
VPESEAALQPLRRDDGLTATLHAHAQDGGDSPELTALWEVLRGVTESAPAACAEHPSARAGHAVERAAHSFIGAALFGREVSRPYPAMSTSLLRCALEEIRRAFLGRVGALEEPPPVDALLCVLQAFDRVYDGLETDEARSFQSRFEAPDAFSLVVELAHDMRSPLTSILFLVDTLRQQLQRVPSNSAAPRQLNIVYSAAFHLSALVSDIVDLAQNGARLLEREPLPLSIAEMMRSVQEMVQPIAEEKRLAIRTVPPGCDTRIGQPLALCRVLLNLTTNALKFTSEGQVTIAATELADSRVRFEVRDTGRGIPTDVVDSLFTPYLARTSYTDRAVGLSRTRLGLAICDALIRRMGSQLQVESTLGEGTCFSFELDMPSPPPESGHVMNRASSASRSRA